MHILVIVLFLLHRYSTGNPVLPNETKHFIPSALEHLANTCDNSFIADAIKNKSDYCIHNEAVNSRSELECFMFYDINYKLCTVFGQSKFNLQENYMINIKHILNVASLCDDAVKWKFATVQNYPLQSVLDKVFSDPVNCQKLCGLSDLFNDDANYYCKYFKWGTDVIQSQIQPVVQHNTDAILPVSNTSLSQIDNSVTAINANNASVTALINNEKPVDSKPEKTVNVESNIEKTEQRPPLMDNQPGVVLETNNNEKSTKNSVTPVGVLSVKVADANFAHNVDKMVKNEQLSQSDSKDKHEEAHPEDDENDNDDYDQPNDLQVDEVKKDENGVVIGESDPEVAIKGGNNAKIGIESITSNNGNPHKGGLVEPDPNANMDIKDINNVISQKELFHNAEAFTDDDDHFFPIFLTVIVIVVLLYILYHNKSKFTKVLLGIIVEGRQSGRRRNSRGHAYRRLDTLEQAMSSNTAAPPSKIIY